MPTQRNPPNALTLGFIRGLDWVFNTPHARLAHSALYHLTTDPEQIIPSHHHTPLLDPCLRWGIITTSDRDTLLRDGELDLPA